MKHVYSGKTKDVYQLENGHYLLRFKDDMTGANGVFDPGSNEIGLTVEGAGQAGLRLTAYFFELLEQAGIPTHFVSADLHQAEMEVLPAQVFGKGLEVICRYRAVGSFFRRYGNYVQEGAPLDAFVEVTLKDDNRQDPPISQEALEMLSILKPGEYQILQKRTRQIGALIREELAQKGLDLYDIKFEFGRNDGDILLIDEISGGNMRVYQQGIPVEPLELVRLVLGE